MTLSNVTDGNKFPEFFDPAAVSQSGANGEMIDFGVVDFMADGSSPTSYAAVDSMMMAR
ncbi:MAG: hypothetical protein ACU85U_15215 [Gammaproteobacteria bacterium]